MAATLEDVVRLGTHTGAGAGAGTGPL